jgi:hypothetical protein
MPIFHIIKRLKDIERHSILYRKAPQLKYLFLLGDETNLLYQIKVPLTIEVDGFYSERNETGLTLKWDQYSCEGYRLNRRLSDEKKVFTLMMSCNRKFSPQI